MVKHEQTKSGKLQYLSPKQEVLVFQAVESLLAASMSIPDIGEVDLDWSSTAPAQSDISSDNLILF